MKQDLLELKDSPFGRCANRSWVRLDGFCLQIETFFWKKIIEVPQFPES